MLRVKCENTNILRNIFTHNLIFEVFLHTEYFLKTRNNDLNFYHKCKVNTTNVKAKL